MSRRRSVSRGSGVIAENRRARHDFEIIETFEAGLVLQGSEVKSLRAGGSSIAESYLSLERGEAFLVNANVPAYSKAKSFPHLERRPRKLLLRRRELDRLSDAVRRGGFTAVPLKLYFSDRQVAKLLVALARGKKKRDKRETEKRRDWERQKARLLRAR